MRNLKRVLSLVMACAMMLSLMVFTASAAESNNLVDFTDRDEITNIEAVDILVTLGVIDGKDDGSFDPTGIVTRAEMAKLIAVVLNGGEDPLMGSEASNLYTDTANHWAKAYIAYCTNLGIISGRGDGTFDPEATVTGVEAAKMMLTALGYDADVFGFTGAGWDTAVNVQANSAKLYAGVDNSNISAGMTRDNVAQLIYNGLNALIMEKTYDKVLSNGEISYNYALSDYKTLMYTAMGAYRIEGIVVANEYADIEAAAGSAALLSDRTRVEVTNADEIQKLNTGEGRIGLNIPDNSPATTTATFEMNTGVDVLGQKVVFYVRPSSSSNSPVRATVLGYPVIASDSTVATTTSKLKDTDAFTDFLKGNGMKVGTAANAPDYIYNYATTSAFDTNARGVELTAVDWDSDGFVDILMKVEYSLDKVEVVNNSKDTITFTGLNTGKAIDVDDIVTDLELAEDDIVLAAAIADKYYIVEPETITGIASEYDNDGNLTVDGTKYAPSEVSIPVALTEVTPAKSFTNTSNEAIFYLDLSGNIIAADTAADLTSQNIVYVAQKSATDSYNSAYDAYIYFPDGTKGVYDIVSYNSSGKASDIAGVTTGLYAHTLTDNGIALKDTGDGSISSDYTFTLTDSTYTITKGQAENTVDGTQVYFTSDTVFYLKDTTKSVSSGMKVVTGISNVATQTFDSVTVAYKTSNGRNIALAVYAGVADEVDTAVSTATLFVPSTNWSTVNATEWKIDVIFTGDEETTTITANAKYPVGVYNYSTDSKGVYTLEASTVTNSYSGLLEVVADTLFAGGNQVNKLSGGLVFDATDARNISLASDSIIRDYAYGYAVADKDNDLQAVYVVGKYDVDPAIGTLTVTSGTGVESDPFVLSNSTVTDSTIATQLSTDADITAGTTSASPVVVEPKGTITIGAYDYDLFKVSGKDDDGYTITTMWYAANGVANTDTADITFALTTPSADSNNTIAVNQTAKTVAVNVAYTTADVVITGKLAAGQTVAVSGTDVADVTLDDTTDAEAPTFTVDVSSLKNAGGAKTFTVTVSEDDMADISYTVTLTMAAPTTPATAAKITFDVSSVTGNATGDETLVLTVGTYTGTFTSSATEAAADALAAMVADFNANADGVWTAEISGTDVVVTAVTAGADVSDPSTKTLAGTGTTWGSVSENGVFAAGTDAS